MIIIGSDLDQSSVLPGPGLEQYSCSYGYKANITVNSIEFQGISGKFKVSCEGYQERVYEIVDGLGATGAALPSCALPPDDLLGIDAINKLSRSKKPFDFHAMYFIWAKVDSAFC